MDFTGTSIHLETFNPKITTLSEEISYSPSGLMANLTLLQEKCPEPSKGTQSPILFYAVFSSIFLLGIVGNSVLILIFIRHKVMRTAPNTYILSLGVADLLTAASCASAPLLASQEYSHPIICKFFQTVLETAMGVSSYNLVALSAERYYAIARPLHRKAPSKTFTLKIVFLIWIASISFTIIKLCIHIPSECSNCVQMFNPSSFSNSYTLVDFLALYLIPLGIIADFYILMAQELYFSGKSISKESTANNPISHHLQVRKRIAFTVLVLVFMFALCYLPFNYMSLRLYFDHEYARNIQWSLSTNLLFCVGCIHNCFNPVILYSLSKSFRGHFNNYLYYSVFRYSKAVEEEHTRCNCADCCTKTGNTIKRGPSVI